MFYSLINLGYFSTVTIYTSSNLTAYQNTKAPELLKNFRNFINLAFCGFWYALGIFALYQMGSSALFNLFLLDDDCIEIIKLFPTMLPTYYLILKSIVIFYEWYQWYLIEDKNIVDNHLIALRTINFSLELLLILSVLTCLPVTWVPTLFFLNFCFSYWNNLVMHCLEIYERTVMHKKLDWDLILAQIYLDLTTAILLTMLLLNFLSLGDEMLNAIMFLKAAVYIGLKTLYDVYNQPEMGLTTLFQGALFITQFALGMGFLTGLLVLPANAWLSILLFKVLTGTSIWVALPSLIKSAQEYISVKKEEENIFQNIVTQNMSVKDYFLFKRQSQRLAKENVWESNIIFQT
ncbi:MAG: hypothetical protein QG556_346 [Pseudomonadota bacterium]|nr:hypothetical protein [Pseudomonadota bacterium]